MIDTDALRAEMARNHITQDELSKRLGITSATFRSKVKKGVFDTNEVEVMMDALKLKEPMTIFFHRG